jgi:hypothetical protein
MELRAGKSRLERRLRSGPELAFGAGMYGWEVLVELEELNREESVRFGLKMRTGVWRERRREDRVRRRLVFIMAVACWKSTVRMSFWF